MADIAFDVPEHMSGPRDGAAALRLRALGYLSVAHECVLDLSCYIKRGDDGFNCLEDLVQALAGAEGIVRTGVERGGSA